MKEKFHFIGIKGSGMSSLAQILFDNGYEVQGSDIEDNLFTQKGLDQRGVSMFGFSKENITGEHTYIIGNAFNDLNEEVKEVMSKKYKSYRYHDFLGQWMKKFTSVGISGTHGKTSTTSLLSHVLTNLYPTSALIGDGTGYGMMDSKYFSFEACEYKRHFLSYGPDYAIITNIDFDHPDYFQGLNDVLDAFNHFADNATKKVIVCGDDAHTPKLQKYKQTVTYGLNEGNDIRATDIDINPKVTSFNVNFKGEDQGRVRIPLHGNHAIQNTLAVLTVCLLEGMSIYDVAPHLMTFKGAKRRFNIEEWNDAVIVDDYAHHPREIEVTIETARQKYPDKEVVAIFQPHTFTRTATFLNEFTDSLNKADKVYGCPIFGSAREKDATLTIEDLLNLIPNGEVLTVESIEKLSSHQDSVLLFMGAGDIGKFIEAYKNYNAMQQHA
ncbi:UDP-N-acetylmuramate--L-alanine ligase [Priestia megaterium]|uniref:UDP-N-acetylmuramate--L-alanine ligase n=1 Tax=Priestia megaterium TaxID=1404 RepID=A0A6M6EB19_PRIMG|nr:UDP-N-acetylmuramate--L-alanine ligase [Priestia megaterium]QJX80725.1 UDP-N-acetylmuramate--L-alanine ligase [Priestia megaterium]